MENANLPRSAKVWFEEQGYTDSTIEELQQIGDDEVDALIQTVQNSGEESEVERLQSALQGVRYIHHGTFVSKTGKHLGDLQTKHGPHKGQWNSCTGRDEANPYWSMLCIKRLCMCSGGQWMCCESKDQSSTTCESNPYQVWNCCNDGNDGIEKFEAAWAEYSSKENIWRDYFGYIKFQYSYELMGQLDIMTGTCPNNP